MHAGHGMMRWIVSSAIACDAVFSGTRITMIGRGSLVIEGQEGVVEFCADRIRLRTKDGEACILGTSLCLSELSTDTARIDGKDIRCISYEADANGGTR